MSRVNTDIIINAFALLESKIKLNSHLNLQDINIHLENILRDILNIVFTDRNFINLNSLSGNFTSIDLGDNINEVAIQITSTTTTKKVKETISKYKDEYDFKKVIMLYGKVKKPKRKNNFDVEIDGRFEFEEWDFSKLVEKIINCNGHQINQVQQLLINEVTPHLSEKTKLQDDSVVDFWDGLEQKDVRNFRDKLLDVNSNIREARISFFCREIASGKAELKTYPERDVSAIKYRVFEICQEELMDFCDEAKNGELTTVEINNLIKKYTDKAYSVIEERTKDYSYPFRNKDTLKKVVLALIDECYLSFDELGIYQ